MTAPQAGQSGGANGGRVDAGGVQAAAAVTSQSTVSQGQASVAMPHVDAATAGTLSKDSASTQVSTATGNTHAAAATTPDVDGVELPGTSAIHTSTLMQTMSGSEMRVGFHSVEFGGVSIRTSISQQQIVAQISVTNGDLGRALTEQISTAQTKIGDEHGMRTSIEVQPQGGFQGSSYQGSSRDNEGAYARSTSGKNSFRDQAVTEPVASPVVAAAEIHTRLDIRA